VPGLHEYLDDYQNGLERARALLGVDDHRTTDSLQCLPFGPFSERVAPHVAEGSDPTLPRRFRNLEDAVHAEGRAFLVDSTSPDVSIFREPLVPSAAVTCPTDNIFAQPAPFVTTAFGAMAVLARLARLCFRAAHPAQPLAASRPREEASLLHRLLCAFHARAPAPAPARLDFYVAAVAMVMLNVVFPTKHGAAEHALLRAYARAPQLVAREMRAQLARGERARGAALGDLALDAEAVAAARRFWSAFEREQPERCAWARVEPLLVKLLESDGSFDHDAASLDEFWRANDALLRAASWLVHSRDGVHAPEPPSPLAGVRSWTQVRAEHLSPIFVGSTGISGRRVEARAATCGLTPMAFQQVLALLMAAPRLEADVEVQVAHNFGFLIYRPSAAPDVLTTKNKQRSSKAISCVNVDGDEAAFGSRDEKVAMCRLQRRAWREPSTRTVPFAAKLPLSAPSPARARFGMLSTFASFGEQAGQFRFCPSALHGDRDAALGRGALAGRPRRCRIL